MKTTFVKKEKPEKLEIELLLEALFRQYGYDFRNYARASLKRRLKHRMEQTGLKHISEMIPRILYDREFVNNLLLDLSITVTEMFRDPHFYVGVKEKIIPGLKTYPFVKIWHAGCATGEEAYSTAIMLYEENFLKKVRIYATDFNSHSIHIAKEGVYPKEKLENWADNYKEAEGKRSLTDYYLTHYDMGQMHDFLRERVTVSYHNLVTDGVFGEMNMIFCRNVLIYFDQELQNKVLNLFCDSLCNFGFLCLGDKETLNLSDVAKRFELVSRKAKIYRKKC